MKAFKILEVRRFMSQLLASDLFDGFNLSELTLTTNITYNIEGAIHPEFYDTDDPDTDVDRERTLVPWQEVRPFCYSLIRGKRTPLHLKIVFQADPVQTKLLLEQNNLELQIDDIFGLYLNCQFDGNSLTCVTGTSLRIFTMDKSIDYAWDDKITRFFKSNQILFEIPE